jgi:hypothetical protein
MSWGVATQNGVSVSLASIVSLSCGATEFSPASLFTSGVAGAWYDPSDINNYMTGLGPELVTNGNFSSSSNWLTTGNSSVSSGTGNLDGTAVAGLLYQAGIFSIGKCYQVEFDVVSITGTLKCWNNDGTTIYSTTTSGRKSFTYIHAIASSNFLFRADLGSNIASVDNVSVREVTTIANATLFQDSAGTTPVTAVEQPVGLMLDKSQGLVLGSELVTNGDFSGGSTGWTKGADWTIASGTATLNTITINQTLYQTFSGIAVGKVYSVSLTVTSMTSGALQVGIGTVTVGDCKTITAAGTYQFVLRCGALADFFRIVNLNNATTVATVDNISVKEIAGNHASQATSASRPILRARYNQLTYSEQFDNAAWANTIAGTGVAATVTADQGTAPDETTTADRIQFSLAGGTTSSDITRRRQSYSTPAVAHTFSVYLRSYDGVSTYNMHLVGPDGATNNIVVTGSWQRFPVTATGTGTSVAYAIGLRGGQTPANSNTADVLAWGADLRTGSSAGTYQRIAAATDYATAGFLPYLYFVTDDSFATNSIDFTATDKMSVCAGVTKLSDAASAMLVELSANAVLNAGSFNIQAPVTGGNAEYRYGGGGTIFRSILTSGYAAPITNVLAATQDIVGDAMNLRVNGVSVGTSALDQGTGNFGNYPLYIGRRNNASLPFEGRIYGLIVCGKMLSASELSSTESWMNSRTGAY